MRAKGKYTEEDKMIETPEETSIYLNIDDRRVLIWHGLVVITGPKITEITLLCYVAMGVLNAKQNYFFLAFECLVLRIFSAIILK